MITAELCDRIKCASCETQKRDLKFSKGQRIVNCGDKPLGLFIIKSGLVGLEVTSPTGVALTLRIGKAGTFFGYRALLCDSPYYFNAIALEDTELCLMPKEKLEQAISRNPKLAMQIMEQLALDLKESDLRWLAQTTEEAGSRIKRVVHFLESKLPSRRWTKREIAQLAGTTTETAFRTLTKINSTSEKNPAP